MWLDSAEECLRRCFTCHCSPRVVTCFGRTVVAFVSGIILFIGIYGIHPVLTDLCGGMRPLFFGNFVIALLLEFNIFFNYFFACWQAAGAVEEFYPTNALPPPKHVYNDFTYCTKCKAPKPPGAHHCSICCTCVVDMDHHCPFLGNCVGRGNLRYFLLFLLWVSVAMLYAIGVFACSIVKHLHAVQHIYARLIRRRRPGSSWGIWDPSITVRALIMLPLPATVSFVLVFVCLVILVMVGGLCIRHWALTASGETYIGRLKGEHMSNGDRLQNLRHVFGPGHPLLWLRPVWPRDVRCPGHKANKGA